MKMDKRGQMETLFNPRYLTIIAFALLGYFLAPEFGIDRTFGMLIGIMISIFLAKYIRI